MSTTASSLLSALDVPIIQAPMAGVQGSALALAVCRAGGLGSLPAAMLSLDALAAELQALQQGAAGRPYNVNFFCHTPRAPDPAREAAWRAALRPAYLALGLDPEAALGAAVRAPFTAEAAELLARYRPAVVSFHFGLPAPDLLAQVRRWGACVLSSATTVAEGLWLQAQGVDAVIAQGWEAGGHRGLFLESAPEATALRRPPARFLDADLSTQVGTFALLPQMVRALQVPVIAAGGIADAQGVAAALALGASAVQVGTAYLLCDEATTSAAHRAALQSAEAAHTAVTNVFTGRPARGIMNRLMRELGPMSALAPAFPGAAGAVAPLRARAEAQGSGDFSPLWAGQNVTGCRAVPAEQLTRDLAANLERHR